MGDYIGWAFVAAVNPTLLAVTTAIVMLSHPRRMMFGYLCGAWLTSITLGCLIVFQFADSGNVVDTTEHAVVPAIDIAVGTVLLTIVWVIRTGRDTWWRERIARFREERGDKPTPRWRRALRTGSPRVAFVVGVCLTLPGVAYLIGMNAIADQGYSDVDAVAAVVLFCAIMLLLVEVPLVAALFAPERADRAIEHVGAYLRANIRTILLRVGMIVGALIALRGVLTALGVI